MSACRRLDNFIFSTTNNRKIMAHKKYVSMVSRFKERYPGGVLLTAVYGPYVDVPLDGVWFFSFLS